MLLVPFLYVKQNAPVLSFCTIPLFPYIRQLPQNIRTISDKLRTVLSSRSFIPLREREVKLLTVLKPKEKTTRKESKRSGRLRETSITVNVRDSHTALYG